MDIQQMYNYSAMLRDALISKSNSTTNEKDKRKFDQLAKEQQNISDQLKPKSLG